MRTSLFLAFTLLSSAFAQQAPVVTIEPACAEWQWPGPGGGQMIPPRIAIRYDPRAPAARLKSPQSVTLVLATGKGLHYESTAILMTRLADGTWQSEYTPARNYSPGYSILFFEDDKGRVDHNGAQYWDLLDCRNGEPAETAVDALGLTYEGRLLAPGIQRRPDLARALEVFKTDLKKQPTRYHDNERIWEYEVKLGGGSAAAYQQVAGELESFLSAHSRDPGAVYAATGFVEVHQQKLPPALVQRLRDVVTALPETADLFQHDGRGGVYPVSRTDLPRAERLLKGLIQDVMNMLADLDYWSVDLERTDSRKKADDYLAFATRYPESRRIGEAYGRIFECKKELNDVAGAEAAFEKWVAADPPNIFPIFSMVEFYLAQKAKPDRALDLLDQAAATYRESLAPSSHRHFPDVLWRIAFLRGQAHRLLKDLPAARADLEAAAQAAPDNPDILWTLGQVCEEMGDYSHAVAAYLSAASAPTQESSAPREAYERLFAAQGLGSSTDAGQKLLAEVAARTRHAAAEYTPIAMTRPAPEFAFTDLAGKPFDNRTVKGKPAILTFWAFWCAPCVAELSALEKFQQEHPDANLLAVEIGHKPEEVAAFLKAHNLKALHVAATAGMPRELGVVAVPAAIVIDRYGQIQFVHIGQLADAGAILGKDLSAFPAQ